MFFVTLKDKHLDFITEVLRPAKWATWKHLKVGTSWCIRKENLHDLERELNEKKIPYVIEKYSGVFVITTDDKIEWYKNGKLHRTDGPAIEWVDGFKEWYQDGIFQRSNTPKEDLQKWLEENKKHFLDFLQ